MTNYSLGLGQLFAKLSLLACTWTILEYLRGTHCASGWERANVQGSLHVIIVCSWTIL